MDQQGSARRSLTARVRKAESFVQIQVTGSNGKKYNIAAPKSQVKYIPKQWKWTTERYKVAEMIADGIPITHIARDPELGIKTRQTIYGWLEHPEFREHIDGLILETGLASKRERVAGMKKVTQQLFEKITEELDDLKLNDRNIGAILSNFQSLMKQLAQEKEELVELQRVQQNTSVDANIKMATVNIEELLKSVPESERKQLEHEFDKIGDEMIRKLTGGNDH